MIKSDYVRCMLHDYCTAYSTGTVLNLVACTVLSCTSTPNVLKQLVWSSKFTYKKESLHIKKSSYRYISVLGCTKFSTDT